MSNGQRGPGIKLKELVEVYRGHGFYFSEGCLSGFTVHYSDWNEEMDALFGETPMFEAKRGKSNDEVGLLEEDGAIAYISELTYLQDTDNARWAVRVYF